MTVAFNIPKSTSIREQDICERLIVDQFLGQLRIIERERILGLYSGDQERADLRNQELLNKLITYLDTIRGTPHYVCFGGARDKSVDQSTPALWEEVAKLAVPLKISISEGGGPGFMNIAGKIWKQVEKDLNLPEGFIHVFQVLLHPNLSEVSSFNELRNGNGTSCPPYIGDLDNRTFMLLHGGNSSLLNVYFPHGDGGAEEQKTSRLARSRSLHQNLVMPYDSRNRATLPLEVFLDTLNMDSHGQFWHFEYLEAESRSFEARKTVDSDSREDMFIIRVSEGESYQTGCGLHVQYFKNKMEAAQFIIDLSRKVSEQLGF